MLNADEVYLSNWLRGGDAGPGASHGGDDPHNGLDGRPPPGGWGALPAYDDANSAASAAAHPYTDPPAIPVGATPGAVPMPFDENARAGNLYMGGFVPLINYGWANQGNPGIQQAQPGNPYAGYTTGMRQLDQGIGTLYGTPETPPPAASAATGTTTSTTSGGSASVSGGGDPGGGGGQGGGATGGSGRPPGSMMDDDLNRYLYGR